jgi:hypothetical protein
MQPNFYKTEQQRPSFIKTKMASAGATLLSNAQTRPVTRSRTLTTTVGTGPYTVQADGAIPVGIVTGSSRGYLTVSGADTNGDVKYTLRNMGMDDVTIAVVVDAGSVSRSIVVTGHAIVINVATTTGVINATETGTAIAAAVNANASASALVNAVAQGTGLSLTAALSATAVPQGVVDNPVAISGYTQVYTGASTVSGTNFSVNYATGKVTFHSGQSGASVTLVYKTGITATPATITSIVGTHQKVFGRLIRSMGQSKGSSPTYRTDFFDLSSRL